MAGPADFIKGSKSLALWIWTVSSSGTEYTGIRMARFTPGICRMAARSSYRTVADTALVSRVIWVSVWTS